ncbi:copper-binding protein [Rhodoferax sp.]|uniref:copper-binding protein n=1 Tax=Rhodoferax sp. TaxID=50421 RepID=UPI0025E75096|nr:copper-binding protein [Rhodoferax sp.]MCM2295648.1 copper-binding protein [Rhodoferax sp.]
MKILLAPTFMALGLAFSASAMAQMDHNMHTAQATKPVAASVDANALGDALVKKVDKTKSTVTLQHGALPNGMPPMTMAYKVKDTAWLDQLKTGQKIRFATDPADGGMTVLRYELVE